MHIGSGWETPRVDGVRETDDPPCKIHSNHPRVGRYGMGLLGTECNPGVVMHSLRLSPVPAFNILTFQFTDATISATAILTCDGMGDSATNPIRTNMI